MAGKSSLDKGKRGEREIATALNLILSEVMAGMGYTEEQITVKTTAIQRNQNQSAVGGNDLTNTMGLGIEVKRHENLSGINGWWAQCVEGAARNNDHPVLLYRQNNAKWRCRTFVHCQLPEIEDTVVVVGDMAWEDFQKWFRAWCRDFLSIGGEVRS